MPTAPPPRRQDLVGMGLRAAIDALQHFARSMDLKATRKKFTPVPPSGTPPQHGRNGNGGAGPCGSQSVVKFFTGGGFFLINPSGRMESPWSTNIQVVQVSPPESGQEICSGSSQWSRWPRIRHRHLRLHPWSVRLPWGHSDHPPPPPAFREGL